MPDKLSWITDELNALQGQGLRTTIRTIGSACRPWMVVDGKRVLLAVGGNSRVQI